MKQGTVLSKIVMTLLFVGVVAYLAFSALKIYTNPFRTVVVYNDVVESSILAEGWFFRDEVRLDPASGLISYRLDEGEKAKYGELAAVAYQDQEAMVRQQQIQTILNQKNQLDYARADDAPTGSVLDSQLQSTHAQLQNAAARGDFSKLISQADQYKRLSLRRESLSSSESEAAIGLASVELGTKLETLSQGSRAEHSEVYVPQSGVFSSQVDGYEEVLKPELLTEDLTVEEFEALVATPPMLNDGAVGKVATNTMWYLALVVPEDKLPLFQQKSTLSVRFTALVEAVPMSVSQLGFPKDGKALVVLSSRRNLAETIALRSQSCSVIFRSDRGIRVPSNALRILEDGSVGVYTVTGLRAEGKPVTVTAEGSDYYIVEPNPKHAEDTRILRSGDEVIIAAAELYDGKVVR